MGFVSEFKKFIMRGNVIDLAVGVIIGAAFGKIVSSFVADVIMPPIGYLVGGVNFKDLNLSLGSGAQPVTLNYGNFLQATFDFLVVALCVFVLVKAVSAVYRREEARPAEPSNQEKLLAEIRDLLRARA